MGVPSTLSTHSVEEAEFRRNTVLSIEQVCIFLKALVYNPHRWFSASVEVSSRTGMSLLEFVFRCYQENLDTVGDSVAFSFFYSIRCWKLTIVQ